MLWGKNAWLSASFTPSTDAVQCQQEQFEGAGLQLLAEFGRYKHVSVRLVGEKCQH